MALAAVLAALGLGSFQSLLRTNRHAAEVNALVDDLAFSRSEAIKHVGTQVRRFRAEISVRSPVMARP